MHAKKLALFALSVTVGLAVLLGGCSRAPAPPEPATAPPEAPSSTATPEEASDSESATAIAEETEPLTPEQVAERFYSWYIGYIRNVGNPMTDGAHRSSEYVTEEFIHNADEIIASFDQDFDQDGYDPFLYAQDIPEEFTVEKTLVSGEEASVVVREVWNPGTRYELIQDVEVALWLVDGHWKIADITVAMTPEEVVEAFYWWYTGYPGNSMTDKAYRSSEYVTREFVQKADEIIASFGHGGYDPFLCTQDIPQDVHSFTIEETIVSGDEASVIVRTSLEDHMFTVELQHLDRRWAISDVTCTEVGTDEEEPTAAWQVLVDEKYNFQLRFPENWTYEERPPAPQEMETSDELKALKQLLIFEPQGWDGVAPPLHVAVTEGTEEEFERIYAPAASTEALEINGYAVVKAIDDLGEAQLIRYTFQSPTDESIRIVVIDSISGFPERAEGNEAMMRIVQQILYTFEFTQ